MLEQASVEEDLVGAKQECWKQVRKKLEPSKMESGELERVPCKRAGKW